MLDESLLVAAHGRAHPDVERSVEIEDSRSPIDAWIVDDHNGNIPKELIRRAKKNKGPVYATIHHERVVLLAFEVEDDHRSEVRVAAAGAPEVTLSRSVGAFALIYSLLSFIALILGTFAQLRAVRAAFGPLDKARMQASQVMGFGENQRLDTDAPDEVAPLLRAINELLERLERSYQAQTRFTAEAAHELRTPVTTMLGELDVALRKTRSAEDYQEVLASVREDIMRLRHLVDGLTTLTRIDATDLGRTHELMRAGELASNALATEAATLRDAGNSIEINILDDPEISVHRSLVEAALGNLLRNTARHAPGSRVLFQVKNDGDFVVFTVDDAGPGIPEKDLATIFDRFVRGAEARGKDPQGLGLGLAITREVARRHGGDCTLSRSPMGGLKVCFSLPKNAARKI
jgi:signal transduction histidine kinase